MNQILYSEHKNILSNKKKKQKKFKLLLCVSIFFMFFIVTYFLYYYYIAKKNEIFSKKLLNNFNLESLYFNSQEYTSNDISNNNSFVIGNIQIPKININYPILSNSNDELLKIAPCRFYGPSPNQNGNLCIAAHNYNDDRFFSNLHKLSIGDLINILDINNNIFSYQVYDKFEILKTDTSCTSQNTDNKRELTLVTCNNFNGNRLIVKAEEIKK
jgi:sortase A